MAEMWDGLTPCDEAIGIYDCFAREAFKNKTPLHDYQQMVDKLKALRTVWVAAMNSPDVRQMAEALRKTQREINHMPVDERDASPMILQIWEWGGKALAGYEAGLKEATNA